MCLLPISAGPSLSNTLNIILPSDTLAIEITPSSLLKKISAIPKIPRTYQYQFQKRNFSLFSLRKLIIPRKWETSKDQIKSKSRGKLEVSTAHYFRSKWSEYAGSELRKIFIIKRHQMILTQKAVSAEKTTCKELER
jgi:hypothetical protein